MFEDRWLITGTLTTLSPLHIGGGEPLRNRIPDRPGHDAPPLVAAVVTDCDGRPYLPGRSLKNNLRSWLDRTGADPGMVEQLFGTSGISSLEERQSTGQQHWGGKLEFLDAFLADAGPGAAAEEGDAVWPFWDPGRHTAVAARTAIDRRTRTVREKKLFHEEYVPPGIAFAVTIAGQGLGEDEVALLLNALKGFNHGELPVRLGAGRSDGWGRVSWKLGEIKRLDEDGTQEWLQQTAADPAPVGYHIVERFGTNVAEATLLERLRDPLEPKAGPRLQLELELAFQGPFLVNDTARAGGEDVGDFTPLRDERGRPILPASSLRGALRGQAERIVRTIGLRACHVDDPDDACDAVEDAAEVATKLCTVCRLFGAPGWGTPIELTDFHETGDRRAISFRQEMVAIDRFTGGAAEQLKFNADVFWRPLLRGTVTVELDRIDQAGLGVLALTLRDLLEGDIPLGFGVAKGYGALRGRITKATLLGGSGKATGAGITECARSLGDGADPALVDLAENSAAMVGRLLQMKELPPEASFPAPGTSQAPGDAAPAARGDAFHNPYHFVPVAKVDEKHTLDAEKLGRAAARHVTHDRYVPGAFSGRILCRLVTESPLVIGNQASDAEEDEHQGNTPRKVQPFLAGDEPVIPGSSLRGMISSLAEAASNSALRVLTDSELRVRIDGRKYTKGQVWEYFRAIDPELLPFNSERTVITIAEQLFGFVEQIPEGSAGPARALAGRVRFSFGLLAAENREQLGANWKTRAFLGPVTLKILSTPKPPSPALYFTKPGAPTTHIAKTELKPGTTLPQGRKMYLHHPHDGGNEPWRTGNDQHNNQKARVKRLRPGLAFNFWIDFDNLSSEELGLLCYALRPTEAFRHKLGMGKPLGLGRVRIEPVAIQYIDRRARYASRAKWPERFVAAGDSAWPRFDELRQSWRDAMDETIRTAIETIGDPASVKYPVHYPACVGASTEGNHYEWFVANDGGRSQQLRPVTGSPVPTLRKLNCGRRGGGHGGRGGYGGGRRGGRRGHRR